MGSERFVCDCEGYCQEITSLFGRSLFRFVLGQIPNPAETGYLIIYMNDENGSNQFWATKDG